MNTFEMRIYNRWGEQVCFCADMDKGWDGKINGGNKLVEPGVYAWQLSFYDVKHKYHNMKGFVMLLK